MPNKRSPEAEAKRKAKKKERQRNNAWEYLRKQYKYYVYLWKQGQCSPKELHHVADQFQTINEYCLVHPIPTLPQWRYLNCISDPYPHYNKRLFLKKI